MLWRSETCPEAVRATRTSTSVPIVVPFQRAQKLPIVRHAVVTNLPFQGGNRELRAKKHEARAGGIQPTDPGPFLPRAVSSMALPDGWSARTYCRCIALTSRPGVAIVGVKRLLVRLIFFDKAFDAIECRLIADKTSDLAVVLDPLVDPHTSVAHDGTPFSVVATVLIPDRCMAFQRRDP